MASSYTFERIASGYRFLLSDDSAPRASSSAPSGPMRNIALAWGGVIVLFVITHSTILFILAAAAAGYYTYKNMGKSEEAAHVPNQREPTRPRGNFFEVTTEEITTVEGRVVPVRRINEVEIKNAYDVGYRVEGRTQHSTHVSTGFASATSHAATGMASAIGQGIANKRAQTAFYVSVQHGGEESKVAERLTQNVARGLQADILRVLTGESLE